MSPVPSEHRYCEDFGQQDSKKNRFSSENHHDCQADIYQTETDFSPPRTPTFYKSVRYYDNSPTHLKITKSTDGRRESSSEKSNIQSSDEWDRQTY